MSYRSWNIKVFVMLLLVIGPFAFFNYYIDPMWTYGTSHEWNDRQDTIDERQQKTNEMTFQPFGYEGLLLGSSRSTYIHPDDFQGIDVYNFAVSDMTIREYQSFLDYAVEQNGKPFKKVFIGFDFFKSSVKEASTDKSLAPYIETVEENFYRSKNLISLDVYDYSKENYAASKEDDIRFVRTYNRENQAFAKKVSDEESRNNTMKKVEKFRSTFYSNEEYEYYEEFRTVIKKLQDSYPETEFVAFTTPISSPLYEALLDEGRQEDYRRWLYDLSTVFGSVYNFMGDNEITRDLSNYFDGHHFYHPIGTRIAERLTGGDVTTDGFGVLIKPEDIEKPASSD